MEQGARFAKWGLGLFIFGVFLTFGIVAHYCVGARWPTGELFMQNISLWWACPWTLSVAAVQAGGLGMVALGLTQMVAARITESGQHGRKRDGAVVMHRWPARGLRRRLPRLLCVRCNLAGFLLRAGCRRKERVAARASSVHRDLSGRDDDGLQQGKTCTRRHSRFASFFIARLTAGGVWRNNRNTSPACQTNG